MALVPSLRLLSQKLHNVLDLQSQFILIDGEVVKDSSEELLGYRRSRDQIGIILNAFTSIKEMSWGVAQSAVLQLASEHVCVCGMYTSTYTVSTHTSTYLPYPLEVEDSPPWV